MEIQINQLDELTSVLINGATIPVKDFTLILDKNGNAEATIKIVFKAEMMSANLKS